MKTIGQIGLVMTVVLALAPVAKCADEGTAEAFLEVKPGQAGDDNAVKRCLGTHAWKARSRTVLQAALKMPQVTTLAWYRRKENLKDAVEALGKAVTTEVIPNTYIIKVSVTCADRNAAVALANAVAMAHVETVVKATGTMAQITIIPLQRQLIAKQSELAEIRNQQRRARTRSRSPTDLAARGGALRARMEAYGRQLTQTGLAVTQARGVNETIKKQLESGELVNSPQVTATVEADPQLCALRRQFDAVTVELAVEKALSSDVKALMVQKDTVKALIDKRMRQVQDYQVKALVKRSRAALDGFVAQQLQIKEQYDSIESRVQEIEAILIYLDQLAVKEDRANKAIDQISRRITDLALTQAAMPPVSLCQQAE